MSMASQSRFGSRCRAALAVAVAMVVPLTTAAVAQAQPAAHAATAAESGVVQRAVTFTVVNRNRSLIACKSDGATYQVRGHITGAMTDLAHPQTATLLLHGLSYGEFFSNYTAQPGYNFARNQAEAGHVTVTVDRLGYGASDKPVGADICFGSRADIAHQMVQQLRAGSYTTSGAVSPTFPKVVLAGHSVGAIIAQAEAYSFGDIDGLVLLSYSDTDVSLSAQAALGIAIDQCKAGGQRQGGTTGPNGYIYFGADTPEKFIEGHFYTPNADPKVVETTAALRNRDPCGDILSYKTAVAANLANVGKIKTPTLVLAGGRDAIYPVPATKQASLLTGSEDVTPVTVPETGHALTLHRSADQFEAHLSSWLVGHQFGGWVMPAGAADTGGGSAAAVGHQELLSWGIALVAVSAGMSLVLVHRRRASGAPIA